MYYCNFLNSTYEKIGVWKLNGSMIIANMLENCIHGARIHPQTEKIKNIEIVFGSSFKKGTVIYKKQL